VKHTHTHTQRKLNFHQCYILLNGCVDKPASARQPRRTARLPDKPVPTIDTAVMAGPHIKNCLLPTLSDNMASGGLLNNLAAPKVDPTNPNSAVLRPSSAANSGMTGRATPMALPTMKVDIAIGKTRLSILWFFSSSFVFLGVSTSEKHRT
jgi:hypothetical protein